MSLFSIQAIVLAAGRSSRFKTTATKLSFPLCGQEMIVYPTQVLAELGIPITVVLGYKKELVKEILNTHRIKNIQYKEQSQQKGTGHAVLITRDCWSADNILIINGDMPLITTSVIESLINRHISSNATITFVTAEDTSIPAQGYGRVIKQNNTLAIVEACDFNNTTNQSYTLNAGIYIIKRSFLESALPLLKTHTNGEIYITDLIKAASDAQLTIETVVAPFHTIQGVNTLKELSIASKIKHDMIVEDLMKQGVHFIMPDTINIDSTVSIGPDSIISPCTQLLNNTKIGKNCFINALCIINNSTIADNTIVKARSTILNKNIPSKNVPQQELVNNYTVLFCFIALALRFLPVNYQKA
jgi:bifunctional UDP-N-acetylglucosamine pyrophosphorylase / glucosamine-1-phosphate N-acetyltransferase